MTGFGHLIICPRGWDDLRPNHRHVLALVAGYRMATGAPLPPITPDNHPLSVAICDLLPDEMLDGDRSAPGRLMLTLLELEFYGALHTCPAGTALTEFGHSLLASPGDADVWVVLATQRMLHLAADTAPAASCVHQAAVTQKSSRP